MKKQLHHTIDLTQECLFASKTLFKEMALLNPNAIKKTTNAFQWVHDNQINGVLIGGMSVAHWTKDRTITPDVDILTSELSKVIELLQAQNIHYNNLASDGRYGGISVPSMDVDFLDATKGNVKLNQYILKTATPQMIGGISFLVIDPATLAIAKMWTGRNKDTEDSFNLMGSGNLNKKDFLYHLKMLSPTLKGSDISPKELGDYANSLIPH